MPNSTAGAIARSRPTAARVEDALAALQQHFESHGWLVFRTAMDRDPFALIAIASPRSSPPSLGWPAGTRWVGVAIVRTRGNPRFEPEELRDVARAYGGRACFTGPERLGWDVRWLEW